MKEEHRTGKFLELFSSVCYGIGSQFAWALIIRNEERIHDSFRRDLVSSPARLPDWSVIVDSAARGWVTGLRTYGDICGDTEVLSWSKKLRGDFQLLESYVALARVRIANAILERLLGRLGAMSADANPTIEETLSAADRVLESAEELDAGDAKAGFLYQCVSSLSDFLDQENAALTQTLQVYKSLRIAR